jgi:hypothetical protein
MTTRKEKIKKLTLIISLMIICGFLISTYYHKDPTKPNISTTTANSSISPIQTTTLLIINGTKYGTQIAAPISAYNLMTQLQNENKITFQSKNYNGMGEFIEEINGVKNGSKNWMYYVNGVKADIGVSNYKINPGDVVSWKYE